MGKPSGKQPRVGAVGARRRLRRLPEVEVPGDVLRKPRVIRTMRVREMSQPRNPLPLEAGEVVRSAFAAGEAGQNPRLSLSPRTR
jgi:hypothetical protein